MGPLSGRCGSERMQVLVQFDKVKNISFAKAQDDIYKSKVFSCHFEEYSDKI